MNCQWKKISWHYFIKGQKKSKNLLSYCPFFSNEGKAIKYWWNMVRPLFPHFSSKFYSLTWTATHDFPWSLACTVVENIWIVCNYRIDFFLRLALQTFIINIIITFCYFRIEQLQMKWNQIFKLLIMFSEDSRK